MLLVTRDIESLFKVSIIQDEKGVSWFKALPHEPEKANFKEVFINFVQNELKGMRIIDGFDNTTEIEFIKVSRNININEAIFLFNTPEDIDVIRN
jgi:outer membrane lipoprotein-sorting protein